MPKPPLKEIAPASKPARSASIPGAAAGGRCTSPGPPACGEGFLAYPAYHYRLAGGRAPVYAESLPAIRQLGCRAVLLVGNNRLAEPLPRETVVFPYAPFARILARASAIVHQGGIGTCAQALAAGRPMLVVP